MINMMKLMKMKMKMIKLMKVMIVKEEMKGDVSPVAMFCKPLLLINDE